MFILYFYSQYQEYHHTAFYRQWPQFDMWRPGEGAWLVPGTDPDDPEYDRINLIAEQDEDEVEEDETLDYMCELLDSNEIEPDEFRRQLLSVGYHPDTITQAITQYAA